MVIFHFRGRLTYQQLGLWLVLGFSCFVFVFVFFCFVILWFVNFMTFCSIFVGSSLLTINFNQCQPQPPTLILRIFRQFLSSIVFCFHSLASFFLFFNLNTHLQSILGVQGSEDGCLVWGVTQAISLVDSQRSPPTMEQLKSAFYIPLFYFSIII